MTGQGDESDRIGQLSPAKRALLEARQRAGRRTPPTAPASAPAGPELSFAQERLWLLGEVTPGLAAYNTTRVVRLLGAVDADRLRGALGVVVERHQVLRTRITAVGER